MKKFSEVFFKELSESLAAIAATGADGAALDLHDSIDAAYKIIRERCGKGNKIMLIGNGGSAGIASHIAVDFWKNGKVRAMSFNDSSLLTCISNDIGYDQVFAEPIKMFAAEGDVLIAISSSGKSPNILNAVNAAKAKKCRVITMSGFKEDNPLRKLGEINYFVPSSGYGFVETAHAALCHVLVDYVIAK